MCGSDDSFDDFVPDSQEPASSRTRNQVLKKLFLKIKKKVNVNILGSSRR